MKLFLKYKKRFFLILVIFLTTISSNLFLNLHVKAADCGEICSNDNDCFSNKGIGYKCFNGICQNAACPGSTISQTCGCDQAGAKSCGEPCQLGIDTCQTGNVCQYLSGNVCALNSTAYCIPDVITGNPFNYSKANCSDVSSQYLQNSVGNSPDLLHAQPACILKDFGSSKKVTLHATVFCDNQPLVNAPIIVQSQNYPLGPNGEQDKLVHQNTNNNGLTDIVVEEYDQPVAVRLDYSYPNKPGLTFTNSNGFKVTQPYSCMNNYNAAVNCNSKSLKYPNLTASGCTGRGADNSFSGNFCGLGVRNPSSQEQYEWCGLNSDSIYNNDFKFQLTHCTPDSVEPTPPELVSPVNNSSFTDSNITLNWKDTTNSPSWGEIISGNNGCTPNDNHYNLHISPGCTGNYPITKSYDSTIFNFSGDQSVFPIGTYPVNNKFCWYVDKFNGGSIKSSPTYQFSVETLPPPPSNLPWFFSYQGNVSANNGIGITIPNLTNVVIPQLSNINSANPNAGHSYLSTYLSLSGNTFSANTLQSQYSQNATNYTNSAVTPPLTSGLSSWFDYFKQLIIKNNAQNTAIISSVGDLNISGSISQALGISPNIKKFVEITGNLTIQNNSICDIQGVLLVRGSVNIIPDLKKTNNNACIIISKGDITIGNADQINNMTHSLLTSGSPTNYDQVNAMLVTDSTFNTQLDNVPGNSYKWNGLFVYGSVISKNIILKRDLNTYANNTQPSHFFMYDPSYGEIFKSDFAVNKYSIREF